MLMVRLFITLLMLMLSTAPVTGKTLKGLTVFNCQNMSLQSPTLGATVRKKEILDYDGRIHSVISGEVIEQINLTRLFLTHMGELCSASHASIPSEYLSIMQSNLGVKPIFIGSVFFSNGSAVVPRPDFVQMSRAVKEYTGKQYALLIIGSADLSGEASFNDWLSLERAQYIVGQVELNNLKTYILALGGRGSINKLRQSNPQYRRADLYALKIHESQ